MNIRWKKTASFLLAAAMLLSGAADHAQAAAPKQKISKKKLTLSVGAAKKLGITNTKGCQVTWKSSRGKVASVTKKGKVVAKRAGSAKITALVKNSKTKGKTVLTCRVTVKGKNKPVEAAVSHSPSAVPPTSSAIAPSISSTPAETEQASLPTPSDAPPTDLPIEMDRPSGTATEGAIDFRGRCQYIGASVGGAEPRKPQGYAIYNTGDLEKIFGENGEFGIWPVTYPAMARYDEAYFQDKMLYCVLFEAGALYYDVHITDVCLAKNERGKEELTLFAEFDYENPHLTVGGDYLILLELNPSDFERAESTRFYDWYVENHRVSDMGSLEMDRPSGAVTEGAIDFRGRCQYICMGGGRAEQEKPQGYAIYNTGDLEKIFGKDGELGKKDGPVFSGMDILPEPSPDEYYQWIQPITDPVKARYDDAYFQDKMLYCVLFEEGALYYDIHITDVCLAKNGKGEEELTLFTKCDYENVHLTAMGVYMILLELSPSDFERAESIRLGDWYVENHRVSDMGSLEMDCPSGAATAG